jgi:hypothetical protein
VELAVISWLKNRSVGVTTSTLLFPLWIIILICIELPRLLSWGKGVEEIRFEMY